MCEHCFFFLCTFVSFVHREMYWMWIDFSHQSEWGIFFLFFCILAIVCSSSIPHKRYATTERNGLSEYGAHSFVSPQLYTIYVKRIGYFSVVVFRYSVFCGITIVLRRFAIASTISLQHPFRPYDGIRYCSLLFCVVRAVWNMDSLLVNSHLVASIHSTQNFFTFHLI